MKENLLLGFKNRFLQYLARFAPGATSLRVWLHRLRGVQIGSGTFIGTDVLIETAFPDRVSIGKNVIIGIRSVLIAHLEAQLVNIQENERGAKSIVVADNVFIGPSVTILPNVKIGEGAVIAAGSVVTHVVPSRTMVQGNPAKPIARCATPLRRDTSIWQFYRDLRSNQES